MQLFTKILCPVDFSEFSALALRHAAALAKENDATLHVYHSMPDLDQIVGYVDYASLLTGKEALLSSTESKLREFVKGIVPCEIEVTRLIGTDTPADAITRLAREKGFDLIVMGTHGHTGFERFFVGSVTNKVLHKSAVPVLTVCKPSHDFVPEKPYKPVQIGRIVCAVDLEVNSLGIAEWALSIGRAYQSTVLFMHVAKQPGETEQMVLDRLKELVSPEAEDWCTVRFVLRSGDPSEEILKVVQESDANLLVMGHHTRSAIEEFFMGSVAKRMVTDSCCPVLVVRTANDAVFHTPVLL